MSNKIFDILAYLERIHCKGTTDVTLETLKVLHTGHVMNIPFENIDVLNKKPISLDINDLFEKIVTNKRGGYCFEMNGLFSFILKNLGFRVTNLLARVWNNGFELTGKTHQILLVEIDDACWLADVGFGGNGPISPILLKSGIDQEHCFRSHRIVMDPTYGYQLQFKIKGEFQPIYAFSLEKCYTQDYVIANYFSSTHPSSRFARELICTIPTTEGRITLLNNQLKIVKKEEKTEIRLASDEQIQEELQHNFGIHAGINTRFLKQKK